MYASAYNTAKDHVEVVARFDEDDTESAKSAQDIGAKVIVGPRYRAITHMWNECFDACSGDIVMQANDDIVFTTPGWDEMVEKAFEEVPDKILLVHGNDVFGHGDKFGPHALVHRKWVTALGYFIAPYFCSDFGDAWLVELSERVGRRRYVPFDIEHRHFSYGFDEMNDETTKERLQRHREDDPDSIYYSPEKIAERQQDAEKLAKLMDSAVDTHGWTPPKGTPGVLSVGKCPNPKCGSIMTVPYDGKYMCNSCGVSFERMKR
jgi:hypothetical protein